MEPNERILELNKQLEEELNKWDALGTEPNQVINFNPTRNDIWLQALTHFLVDKEIIDEDEFVIYFKERMLREFKKVREEHLEPMAARARIALPDGIPRMDVPKGKGKFH